MSIRTALCLLLTLAAAAPAAACVCEDDARSLHDLVGARFSAHDVVGIFEVDGWRRSRESFATGAESGRWVVLQPVRLFKGEPRPLLAHATPRWRRSDCDIELAKGELVLVYADADEPVAITACSASGRLRSRIDELGMLFRQLSGAP